MELDLQLAASFVVLAEELHYGRAAARLNITSPALTKRVQRLERQLGVVVVDRGPAGVVDLTPAGTEFADAVGPLLAHARAARDAARWAAEEARQTDDPNQGQVVRFGIPAGSAGALRALDLRTVRRRVRAEHPGTNLLCVEVDFLDLARCLPDGQVDLLWTDAPVLHTGVTSVRLGLSSRRVGVVGVRHCLADATTVSAAEFVDQRMIYNPAVPEEWMTPFWLGDLRERAQARLIPVDARRHQAVIAAMTRLDAVTVVPGVSLDSLGALLRPVALRDVPPLIFHVARRRAESREAIHTVIDSLLRLGTRDLAPPGSKVEPVIALRAR